MLGKKRKKPGQSVITTRQSKTIIVELDGMECKVEMENGQFKSGYIWNKNSFGLDWTYFSGVQDIENSIKILQKLKQEMIACATTN
jgi:hypothetical protein